MHPIERLRAVARAGWAEPDVLAAEAAWALADLAVGEPHALVPACRRLLERHPGCGPLWWVAARVLTAGDPVGEAERCGDEIDADPTEERLDEALDEVGRAVHRGGVGDVAGADVVVIPTLGVGAGGAVIDADSCGLLQAAWALDVPVWIRAGVGRVLPARLWESMATRLLEPSPPQHAHLDATWSPWGRHQARPIVENLRGVTRVVGPAGALEPQPALASATCPEPPELLGRW